MAEWLPPAELAENHKNSRKSLYGFLDLQPDIEVIGEAENGREAIERCIEFGVDLVLMDLNMPDINGIEATRKIVAEFPQISVIILTMHSDKSFASEALKAGAGGYLVKDSASDELVDAIREVSRGNIYLCQSLLTEPKVKRRLFPGDCGKSACFTGQILT